MSYRIGERLSSGAIIERCPHCGDTLDAERGHFARYSDGGAYCYRCSAYERPKLALAHAPAARERHTLQELGLPERAPKRPTRLACYDGSAHGYGAHDVFAMFAPDGTLCGAHARGWDKRSTSTLGIRGHSGYPATDICVVLEGPYDVLYEDELCVFGSVLDAYRLLSGVSYVLCPDGDVDLRGPHARAKLSLAARDRRNNLLGVQLVRGNPRDTPPAGRAFVPVRRLLCS
jgi:hypothetical protein